MASLLAVVVLCCSGLFMFATCNKNAAKYEVQSLACENFKNADSVKCENKLYLFGRQICSYMCDGDGKLLIRYCEYDNTVGKYPLCNDLVCKAPEEQVTATTEEQVTATTEEHVTATTEEHVTATTETKTESVTESETEVVTRSTIIDSGTTLTH